MVDAVVHYQGHGEEQRAFPALPHSGDLLEAHGQLWRVSAVVFGLGADLYAVRMSDGLAAELRAEWETWSDTPAVVDDEHDKTTP